ncbi:MAG: DUF2157 domain-containing protein [Kiritimatiellia bacterium]
MNKKTINWLQTEIDFWLAEGVITAAAATQLKSRYERLRQDQRPIGLIILGALGALLIGLGIISLLAANWGDLPRDARVVISFLPLILSYSAALYALLRAERSLAFCEPLGIFWGLSIGAGIALISQTYHLPGELSAFLMTWMLLLVPVVYLTRSLGCVAGYYIGLLSWSIVVQSEMGVSLYFWPVSALILPVVISVKRENPTGMRGVFMFWSLLISTIVALGVTLDKSLPGLWIIIYVAFFATLLLAGVLESSEESEIWSKPMSLCGAGGLATVLYLLCYKWPWKDVGPSYYRDGYGYYLWASVVYDFALVVLLLAGVVFLLLQWSRRRVEQSALSRTTMFVWLAAPLAVTVFYGIASYAESTSGRLCGALISVYVIILSLLTLADGIGRRALWMVNCGVLLFLAVVLGKFFNEDFSFTIKGVVFIVCGLLFFLVNTIFARKIKQEVRS